MGVDTKAARVFDDHRLFYSGISEAFLRTVVSIKMNFVLIMVKKSRVKKKCYPYVFMSRIQRMLFRMLEK